mmetsp:Transcript_20059/g.63954  ORF Transcript_20059/g.63954 Transcript_20059/m.63954 type:complete len:221 (+) Transcript_20059:960-1622(+)
MPVALQRQTQRSIRDDDRDGMGMGMGVGRGGGGGGRGDGSAGGSAIIVRGFRRCHRSCLRHRGFRLSAHPRTPQSFAHDQAQCRQRRAHALLPHAHPRPALACCHRLPKPEPRRLVRCVCSSSCSCLAAHVACSKQGQPSRCQSQHLGGPQDVRRHSCAHLARRCHPPSPPAPPLGLGTSFLLLLPLPLLQQTAQRLPHRAQRGRPAEVARLTRLGGAQR